jgi:hypothetical protein
MTVADAAFAGARRGPSVGRRRDYHSPDRFDQALVAAGAGSVLDAEPDSTVVARTGSRTVLDAASAQQPDVVVVDVSPKGPTPSER